MPSIGAHVSDELNEAIKAKVKDRYRGKTSPYISDLLERDLFGKGSPELSISSEQKPLVKLAEHYCPTRAPIIERWCNDMGVNQADLIFQLLTQLSEEIEMAASPPEHFYVRAEDIELRKKTHLLRDAIKQEPNILLKLLEQTQLPATGLNETASMSHTFQAKRRTGLTQKERDAATSYLHIHKRQERPTVSSINDWLAEHFPDADPILVHHLLLDHGLRPKLDDAEEPAEDAPHDWQAELEQTRAEKAKRTAKKAGKKRA